MATNKPKAGGSTKTVAGGTPQQHLDLSHLSSTEDPPARNVVPPRPANTAPATQARPANTAAAPRPANTAAPAARPANTATVAAAAVAAPAPAADAGELDEDDLPTEYTPPDDEVSEDDPNAPSDLDDDEFEDDDDETPSAAAQTEEDDDKEEGDDDEPVQTAQPASAPVAAAASAPVVNSNALDMARQFLQQREQVAFALRQEATTKRQQAQQIIAEANERVAALNREAAEAEALANSMSGVQASNTAASGTQGGTRRRRRRQGVPNLPSINDTASPVAAPSMRVQPQQEEGTTKAAQTRALNQGKSVRLGILWTLRSHKCTSPKKTMALKEISEWIVKKTDQGGYGYVTQSGQFGNIVRGQLDKLEQEGKIIFDDGTGGYYLSPASVQQQA